MPETRFCPVGEGLEKATVFLIDLVGTMLFKLRNILTFKYPPAIK